MEKMFMIDHFEPDVYSHASGACEDFREVLHILFFKDRAFTQKSFQRIKNTGNFRVFCRQGIRVLDAQQLASMMSLVARDICGWPHGEPTYDQECVDSKIAIEMLLEDCIHSNQCQISN
jgi:hypothetical protein